MAESQPHRGTRYKAFVSYSHKDADAARGLHRRLETYRIPGRLVGSEGLHGRVPARLTPIFRDREDLPAAGDLSETVRAALAASENLIVICSPDAAASPWVGREIALFRELHPGRPVYAAILAGEPPHCFPAELTAGGRIEPLGADLRGEGDGRRLGFLKLAAGIAGVGLDALVQRDAQRRIRRVMGVTGAAVAAMLVMAVLTTMALTARAEADRQRAEAEGLVEFMLTDLRDRLRGVGRLDVLTAVNERALAHYQGQDLDELGPDALERRARILHAMGEDDEKRGLTDRALAQFQEAARTTAALLAENPSAPHRIYAHAQSEYWLGYIAYSKSDWRRAGTHWKRYKELGLHLEAADRSNPDWLREAAYGDGNLCTLHLTAKASPADALASCSAALAKMRAVHGVSGGNDRSTRDLANRHAWMADAYFFAGRSDEALKSRRLQEKLLEPLVRRTPQDASLLDQWMRTLMATAELLLKTGNRTQADNYARRAREVATSLIRHDPANAAWRKWLSRIDKISSRDVGERQW